MFLKNLLNWANMVSEPFYLGRADTRARLALTKFEEILKELGIAPLMRGK